MEDLKEIKLRVKVDTYKELQNYLKNELKITKPEVEKLITKLCENVITQQLHEGILENSIDNAVRESISRLGKGGWRIEERVDKTVEEAVGKIIMNRVREQLTALTLTACCNVGHNEEVIIGSVRE
jgi:chaperonin GroEL (HSP60 family)